MCALSALASDTAFMHHALGNHLNSLPFHLQACPSPSATLHLPLQMAQPYSPAVNQDIQQTHHIAYSLWLSNDLIKV